jgi:prephenate dehydrogenase
VKGVAQAAPARLTVAGVGLIGGSLAAAARAAKAAGGVLGFGRSEQSLETARGRGLVDRVTRDPREAAAADIIVLAAPLAACAGIAAALAPHARPGTVLTDVGSVKARPLAELEAAWAAVGPVVGAHPIAGAETAGPGAARADLFRGRVCIVTPTPTTDGAALSRVRALWEAVGARVEEMPPAVHDELLARVSHLPHLVAWALVGAAGRARAEGRAPLDYAGSGFRDATRIASSPATLWAEILLANRAPLAHGLAELRAELAELERLVAAGDAGALARALDAARALRLRLGER